MKYPSWLHWKGGRSKISGPQMLAARLVLGQLQNMLQLGGIDTGVLRRTLPDGTQIDAHMNAGMPAVRVTPVGAEASGIRDLISTMYVTLFYDDGARQIGVAPAGKYAEIDVDTFNQYEGVGVAEAYIDIGYFADVVGLHASADGKNVYVNNYAGGSPEVYDVFSEIDTKTNEVVRTHRFDGTSPGTAYGAQWTSVSTRDKVYVGTLFGSVDNTGGIVVVSRNPDDPFPLQLIDTSAIAFDIYALAITSNGKYLFAGSIATPLIMVVDTESLLVVATFTADGLDGADAFALSEDDSRLYVVGYHVFTDVVGQDRVVSRFDLAYTDEGVFASAVFRGKVRGGDPDGLRLTPKGDKLYVSDGVNNFIMEYDVEQFPDMNNLVSDDGLTELTHPGRRRIDIVSHGDNLLVPFRFDIAPDGRYLYYPAGGGADPLLVNKVLVLSLKTYTVVAEVEFSGYPVAVTLSNALKELRPS